MSWLEYVAAVACIIFGIGAPFNLAAFLLATVIAIGFAVYKGMILGYGFCPATHTFLTIVMATLISFLWGIVAKFTSADGYSPESGLFKLILGAAAIFLTPFLAYAWAGNLTIDISSSCKPMFIEDLKDYIDPTTP
jgi:hypothetical protein